MTEYQNLITTHNGFEEFVLFPEDHSDFHKLMSLYSQVVLDLSDKDFDKLLDEDDSALSIFILECPHCPSPIAAKNLFDEIDNDKSRIVDYSKDIFILKYSDDECKTITNDYGVYVTSDTKIEYPDIYNLKVKWNFEKGDIHYNKKDDYDYIGWNNLLNGVDLKPINSIIIIDDYIFQNSHTVNGDIKYWGEENLLHLLDAVLPQNLLVDFHVLIVTQNQNNKTINWYNDFVTRFEQDINALRPYNISTGVLIHNSEDFHQRCLITNYVFGESNWGFAAFKKQTAWKKNNLNLSGNYLTINSIGDIDAKLVNNYTLNIKDHISTNTKLGDLQTNMNVGLVNNRLL